MQWKTFLRNAAWPEYGAPAVVLEVIAEPREVSDSGEPIPNRVDVFIGYLDADQDLRIVATDRRRLAPWDGD